MQCVLPCSLNMLSQEDTKRFVAFQGFALCVRVCRIISREQALGYSPPPPSAPACWQAEKPQIQKAAVGGKKSPANAGTKNDYLIIYRWHHINAITQSAVFLPPKADFFYGHRPLFEPCRLLSSCKAWRWGWWRRHGGKLVFRPASPPPPKEGTEKLKPTIKLKVDDGEIAVLPFIICLF